MSKITISSMIGIVFSLFSFSLFAQDIDEAQIKAELEETFLNYVERFAAFDVDYVVENVFVLPRYNLGGNGPVLIPDEEALRNFMENTFRNLESQNYSRSEASDFSICILNGSAALLSVNVTRYSENGSILMQLTPTYIYAKTDDRWRIVGQGGGPGRKKVECQ